MKNTIRKAIIGKGGALLASALLLFSGIVNAQLSERPELAWRGNYDVKMISSQGLQAVWLSNTSPLTAIRPLTDEEMAYEYNDINNNVKVSGNATKTYCGATPIIPTTPTGAVAISQIYADCDDDPTTFQSSAAFLDFGSEMGCTKVKAAYLYWVSHSASDGNQLAAHTNVGNTLRSMPSGDYQGLGGNAYQTVKFKAPGDANYTDVTATRTDIGKENGSQGERYICFADVTNFVQGKTGGLYWVANLRSGFDQGRGGATSGWSLIVIFEPPQCPYRTIKIWDGVQGIGKGQSTDIKLSFASGEVPASGNSISYLGIAVLDGENVGRFLLAQTESPEYIDFTSYKDKQSGDTYHINPFAQGQTAPFAGEPLDCYEAFDKEGTLLGCAYDGISSSRISTYSDETGHNGNDVSRLPNQRNTLGYDAHHLRLPSGAMIPDATNVTMKYHAGPQGGTSPFLAYMAIQTLQPEIILTKTAWKNGSEIQADGGVEPGSTFQYRLSAKNVGSLAANGGAVITDTIDKTMDYVGNVVFYHNGQEIQGGSASVINQGADKDEVVTITLPNQEIAANGDEIVVQFDVAVKGLDRTDIWSLGCNRYVKNKAEILYRTNSDEYKANSNATAGCDGMSVYLYTRVASDELDAQYADTHLATLDLGANAQNMNRYSTLKDALISQLSKLGLPSSDADQYVFYDSNDDSTPITANSGNFATDEITQVYYANALLDGNCEETYTFTVNVKSMPKIDVDKDQDGEIGASGSLLNSVTSAPGAADGELNITVDNPSASVTSYTVSILNSNGQQVYTASSNVLGTTKFAIGGLKAGSYSVVLTDNDGSAITSEAKVDDPAKLSITLTSNAVDGKLCKYQPLTVTAHPEGVPNVGGVNYAWGISQDGGQEVVTQTTNMEHTTPSFEVNTDYSVYLCVHDNKYQEKATLNVASIATPKIEVVKSDTGCREFFLPKDYQSAFAAYQEHVTYPDSIIGILGAQEVSGDPDIDEADLVLTYYTPKNGEQTQMNIDKIEKSQDLIVRVTAGGLCYHQDTTQVIVKSFQDCYPIDIPAFFSPDDNGINDIFKIAGISDWHYESESPEIVVFDRYGKKVYSGNYDDIKAGWDGKCDGKDLPSGDYWYELTYKTIKPKVGHFTLKRRKE